MRFNSVRLRRTSTAVSLVLGAAVLAPAAWAGGAPGTIPTITSPTEGVTVTSNTLTITASSAATHVKFVVDDRGGEFTNQVAVAGGQASTQIPLLGLKGPTSVKAFDCEVGGSCNSVWHAVDITIDLPDPVITSPPADKLVRYAIPVDATAPGGALEFFLNGQEQGTDDDDPFRFVMSLEGKPDGKYTASVRQCNVAGNVCEGPVDKVTVIKDTHGPKFTMMDASNRTVFPVKDRYRDTTRLSARVGEKSLQTTVQIRKAGGPIVRTLKLGAVDRGRIGAGWNGRKDNGDLAPRGKYLFRFVGVDEHGMVGRSNDKVVYVSDKKLVEKHVTKTVSAWGSKKDQFAGSCSSVVRVGSDTVGLRSNSRRNGCTGRASAAVTLHKLRIGRAYKFGGVRVSALGGRTSSRPGRAVMYYVDKKGNSTAVSRLGSSQGWHNGRSVSLDKLLIRGNLFWAIGTANGYWYDVSQFRVTYTATYLR